MAFRTIVFDYMQQPPQLKKIKISIVLEDLVPHTFVSNAYYLMIIVFSFLRQSAELREDIANRVLTTYPLSNNQRLRLIRQNALPYFV